jgi:hypothetical protein
MENIVIILNKYNIVALANCTQRGREIALKANFASEAKGAFLKSAETISTRTQNCC